MEIHSFRLGFWVLILAIFLLSVPSAVVYSQSPEPPANGQEEQAYDEAEANAINQMIMCPVCPAETIDQAQVPLARQMRQIVREMLAEGASREEILDFFAQRYGQDVLAAPPKSGFNLIAWVFPVAGVAAALVAGVLVLWSMSVRKRGGTATEPMSSLSCSDLEAYLEMVDRDLALDQPAGDDRDKNTSGPASVNVTSQREGDQNNNG
jgi:cytochrome c-type biogenesis protein CcmH/NrfF